MHRRQRVTIATVEGPVRLHWYSRQPLLERVRARGDGAAVVRAFEAVGTSRPVELDEAGLDLLREVVERWGEEVGKLGSRRDRRPTGGACRRRLSPRRPPTRRRSK
jgi:hypothetical protein